jgi:hypothetical protein
VNLVPFPYEAAKSIETDLDAWASHMAAIRQPVPDFWAELNTSERLGEWLAALGYRKTT